MSKVNDFYGRDSQSAPVAITGATYNITSADNGRLLTNAGSTNDTVWTLAARSALGNKFECGIVNEVGTYKITITPASGEQLPNTSGVNVSKVLSRLDDYIHLRATDIGIITTAVSPVGEWTLVERKTFATPATSYSFIGLNGDADRRYMAVCFFNLYSSGTSIIMATCNTDTATANYPYQSLYGITTTASAGNAADQAGIFVGYCTATQYTESKFILDSLSGKPRFAKNYLDLFTASAMVRNSFYDCIWKNTADNITQIVFTSDQTNGIASGSYIEIWKLAQ